MPDFFLYRPKIHQKSPDNLQALSSSSRSMVGVLTWNLVQMKDHILGQVNYGDHFFGIFTKKCRKIAMKLKIEKCFFFIKKNIDKKFFPFQLDFFLFLFGIFPQYPKVRCVFARNCCDVYNQRYFQKTMGGGSFYPRLSKLTRVKHIIVNTLFQI